MKTNITILTLISICCIAFNHAEAQTVIYKSMDTVTVIKLKDGTTLIGTLVSLNDSMVVFDSNNTGHITIKKSNVRTIETQVVDRDGKVWFKNPNATRYFLSPSAIPLQKGEGYFQNAELIFCMVNVGVSNHVSIGGGFDVLTGLMADVGGPIACFNVKAGYKLAKRLHAGGGILLAHAPIEDRENGYKSTNITMGYGLLTYGSYDNNITLSGGYGLKNDALNRKPSFSLSAMGRLSPRFSLITENWLVAYTEREYGHMYFNTYGDDGYVVSKYYGLVSYGGRFMSEKISVDFGFVNNPDIAEDIAIGIPYVDFVVKW